MKLKFLILPFLFSSVSCQTGHQCEDLSLNDCRPNDRCRVSNLYQGIDDPSACQRLCVNADVTECNMFDYNSKEKRCRAITCRVGEFDSTCEVQGGLQTSPTPECSTSGPDSCATFRKKDCTHNGAVLSTSSGIETEEVCQELCRIITSCHSYSHNLQNEECVLFDIGAITCDGYVGPRSPSLSDCQGVTTSPNPTTLVTTTISGLINVDVKVLDATTNIPIPEVQISFITLNGSLSQGDGFTDESGIFFLGQFLFGQALEVTLVKEDYSAVEDDFVVTSQSQDQTVAFGLSPLSNLSRIVLSWGANPKDLDLHALQVDRLSGEVKCHVFFGTKVCPEFILDVDNVDGGDDGVETVTILQPSDHVYAIYVLDFSPNPNFPLTTSSATIDIYGSTEGAVKARVPTQEPLPGTQSRYWLVGCLDGLLENPFHLVSVLETETTPEEIAFYCINILQK